MKVVIAHLIMGSFILGIVSFAGLVFSSLFMAGYGEELAIAFLLVSGAVAVGWAASVLGEAKL
jgi:hypothetical protein